MRGSHTHRNRICTAMGAALLLSALTGCERREDTTLPIEEERAAEGQEPLPEEVQEDLSTNSILRADMDVRPIAEPPLEPLDVIVPFGDSGSDLNPDAAAMIEEIVESEQFRKGGAIVLRGHTDSSGRDEVNLRASRRRAEAVAEQLVEAGASEDRITIIAMGEQNPIAPNARPDGEPDEEGRAKNRRVAVTVMPPPEEEGVPAIDDQGAPATELPDPATD